LACAHVSDLVGNHFVEITNCQKPNTIQDVKTKPWHGELTIHVQFSPWVKLAVFLILLAPLVYILAMPLASAVVTPLRSRAEKFALPLPRKSGRSSSQ
jgi:hypothetical protein